MYCSAEQLVTGLELLSTVFEATPSPTPMNDSIRLESKRNVHALKASIKELIVALDHVGSTQTRQGGFSKSLKAAAR